MFNRGHMWNDGYSIWTEMCADEELEPGAAEVNGWFHPQFQDIKTYLWLHL